MNYSLAMRMAIPRGGLVLAYSRVLMNNEIDLDNIFVVPRNCYLLLRHIAHMNVE